MLLADRVLSRTGVALIVALMLLPVYFPIASKYEGVLFPVVTGVELRQTEYDENGAFVEVFFVKERKCDFVGVSWYNRNDYRMLIDFEPEADQYPLSRPVGRQAAGPWYITGATNLDTSHAVVTHRCHPLWLTHTTFYP